MAFQYLGNQGNTSHMHIAQFNPKRDLRYQVTGILTFTKQLFCLILLVKKTHYILPFLFEIVLFSRYKQSS